MPRPASSSSSTSAAKPRGAPARGGSRSFSTALGQATVAWTGKGVSSLVLPSRSPRRGPDRVGRSAVPPEVQRLIRDLKEYFRGKAVLPDATLDLGSATAFQRSVYDQAREIPRGAIVTYGEIAEAIGRSGAARAVGQALGRNPVPVIVPCHRVVASSGGIGGFSAAGGLSLKKKMLALEGVGSPAPESAKTFMPFLDALLSRPRRSLPIGKRVKKRTGVGGRRKRRTG